MTISHVALAMALTFAALTMSGQIRAQPAESSELRHMYEADQTARTPPEGKSIEWQQLIVEDAKRQKRVRQLLVENALQTSADFRRAAMILQHGQDADDYILAHDLATVAVLKGDGSALWLAAASLDRYLRAIGMPQRYGTQSKGFFGKAPQLEPVDPEATDFVRLHLNVPPLAEAMARKPPPPVPTKDAALVAEAGNELAQMAAGQAKDVAPEPVKDWAAVNERANRRRARVAALLSEGLLSTGVDFYHAATLALTGSEPGDFLSAHELSIIAASKGEQRAGPVVAEALDRFLKRIARPQRYATQIEMRYPDPPRLYAVDTNVPDFLRIQFGAPTLASARKREAEIVRKEVKVVFPTE